jgi:hypothetical protein
MGWETPRDGGERHGGHWPGEGGEDAFGVLLLLPLCFFGSLEVEEGTDMRAGAAAHRFIIFAHHAVFAHYANGTPQAEPFSS